MRLVCKEWRETIDGFYGRMHVKKSCLASSLFPIVTLKLPLDEQRSSKLAEFGRNTNCGFVGGRFQLLLSKTKERVGSPIVDKSLETMFGRVSHLSIAMEPDMVFQLRESEEIFRPFLTQMSNVVSFSCNLSIDVELILCLPRLEKLEFLMTENIMAYLRDDVDEWCQVFEKCKRNLKIFSCTVFSRGMELAFARVECSNLEELRTVKHYRNLDYFDDDPRHFIDFECGMIRGSCSRSRFELHLNRNGFNLLLPKLKRIEIPLVNPNFSDEFDVWRFPYQLMELCSQLDSIEEIELHVSEGIELSTTSFPISSLIFGGGSSNLRRIIVNTPTYSENASIWSMKFAMVWPSLRFLQTEMRLYVKYGPSSWLRVKNVLNPKCTEC